MFHELIHKFSLLDAHLMIHFRPNVQVLQIKCYARAASIPVITMPVALKAQLDKVKENRYKKARNQRTALLRQGNRSNPIITCRRKEMSYFKGQTYDKFQPLPLASLGWKNRRSKGDFFVIHNHDGNPALQTSSNNEKQSFADLGLSKEVLLALENCGLTEPTNIQSLTIPSLLQGESIVCAAETGSGKTVAYLVPILEKMIQYKKLPDLPFNSPHCLILVPNRELAEQIGRVCKELCKNLGIKTKVLIGGRGIAKKMLFNPPAHMVDIMVATLGVLRKVSHSRIYSMGLIKHVVIDEADTMFDDSFNVETVQFLKQFQFQLKIDTPELDQEDPGVQLCIIGATLPRDLPTIAEVLIDVEEMTKICTDHVHCLMPHVSQKFMRIKSSDKADTLLQIVKSDVKKNKAVMIFSKNRATCDFISIILEENGIPNISLHGEMSAQHRVGKFKKFQDGEVNVISCTDIASRGLDTLRVQHVINFDFPNFMSDYIHRVGRTGRVGSKINGHVTNFISKANEAELVQKIETSVRKVEELPNVNANIKRKLNSMIQSQYLTK